MPSASVQQTEAEIDWVTRLEQISLPAPRSTLGALRVAASESPRYDKIAAVLRTNPLLCLNLFIKAGRDGRERVTEVRNIEHGVSLLGVHQVLKLCERQADLRTAQPEYLGEVTRGLHAAHIAKAIAVHKGHYSGEEMFWGTLFTRMGYWACWHSACDLMREIEARGPYADEDARRNAERARFDVSLEGLSYQLAQAWRLPRLTAQALSPSQQPSESMLRQLASHARTRGDAPEPEHAELLRVMHAPVTSLVLAHRWVAHFEQQDGEAQHATERMMAGHLRTSVEAARKLALAGTLQCAGAFDLPNAINPGLRLVMLKMDRQAQAEFETQESPIRNTEKPIAAVEQATPAGEPEPSVDSVRSPPQAPGRPDAALLRSVTERLHRQPDTFKDLNDLCQQLLEGFSSGVGLSRVGIALLRPAQQVLQFTYTRTTPGQQDLTGLSIDMRAGLLAQLLRQPTALLLNAQNRDRVLPQLPASFLRATQCDCFMMMSLFANERPVGLCYADAGPNAPTPSALQFKLFKNLAAGANHVLAHLARRAR